MRYLKIFVALMIAVSLSISPVMANISISGGIGLHIFDLEQTDSTYISHGSFSVKNKEDVPVNITLSKQIKLLGTDVDNEGNPRIHKIYTNNITFYEFPTKDWIQLNKTSETIPPKETRIFNYTVKMDPNELSLEQNNTNGFLGYIKIRGSGEGVIGVNYVHKVFVCFDGKMNVIDPPILIIIALILATFISYIILYYKNTKNKIKLEEME